MDEIQEITDAVELATLEAEWNALHEASTSDSVFLSFDWLRAWWTHLGTARQRLFVLCARRQGRLTAILPLMISQDSRRGIALRSLRFLGGGMSDRMGLLADPEPEAASEALAQHLEARSAIWDRLDLSDLPLDAEASRCLARALHKRELSGELREGHPCPLLPIQTDWESFYKERISAKTRSNNRNKTRRLEKQGALRFRFVRDLATDPEALEMVFQMDERDAYHDRPRRRPFDSEAGQRFFREIAGSFSRRGWLYLALMELDGKLIAYRLNFRYRNRHFDYFPGFAPDFNRLSPGRLLMTEILRDCFESGIEEVDFLRGFEEWKAEWTDQARSNANLCGKNPALRSALRRFLHAPRETLGW